MELQQAMETMHGGAKLSADGWQADEYIFYNAEAQEVQDEHGNEVTAMTIMVNAYQDWFVWEK